GRKPPRPSSKRILVAIVVVSWARRLLSAASTQSGRQGAASGRAGLIGFSPGRRRLQQRVGRPCRGHGKSAGVRVGQRVWVAYGGRRAFGQVSSVASPFASDSTGFVVLLDRSCPRPCPWGPP